MNAAMEDALQATAAPVPPPTRDDAHGANPNPNRSPARPPGGGGKWLVLCLIVAAVVIGFLLWKKSNEHAQLAADTRELAVQTVGVTHPGTGPSENEIVLPGNVMAFNEASIFARTNGYLKSWSTDIGAKVTEGQVMAEIEAPDVDAQLRQANATLEQAKANLEIANLNFDRQKDLLAKKVASQQEFDQNRTNVDAMKAAVQADEANMQNLSVQKDFQLLKAPFPGIVTKRNTDVGALINSSNGGQELFRVARTDILRVYVTCRKPTRPSCRSVPRRSWTSRNIPARSSRARWRTLPVRSTRGRARCKRRSRWTIGKVACSPARLRTCICSCR